ncbi:PAAR domain-containing protein [Nevskia sp.]|uniref:PAAR domain-containing protein n=1 Tax=Nevskia sp. TaxID=1929292 RepID=UPI0025E02361|nr:PAAR domain-containing protein [Nevskia sp.]
MGQPAAKQGDRIVATDTHTPPNSTPLTMPFDGLLSMGLSADVKIMGAAAATIGAKASNTVPHPGVTASNMGEIIAGSSSVFINGRPAARSGDTCNTCNDAGDLPIGQVSATGTVNIG